MFRDAIGLYEKIINTYMELYIYRIEHENSIFGSKFAYGCFDELVDLLLLLL